MPAGYDLTFARYEALVLLTFGRRGALPLGKMGEQLTRLLGKLRHSRGDFTA